MLSTDNEGPCAKHLKSLKGTAENEPPRPGMFVPRCDEEGYYQTRQCHASTGYCYCVDRLGQEIEGTRSRGQVVCQSATGLIYFDPYCSVYSFHYYIVMTNIAPHLLFACYTTAT